MSVEWLRQLERFHGIAAWIAIVLLFAATVVLFQASERRRLNLALCVSALACLSLTGALGLMLEGAYRSRLKQRLFMQAPSLGWLFERKEHFAFGSILLAFAAVASLGAAYRFAARPGTRPSESASTEMLARELVRSAKVAWTTAAILALAAAIAATQVARRIHF